MTQRNLAWIAAVLLIYQAAVRVNDPAARALDLNGIVGFWAPGIVGVLLAYRLAT